MIKYQNIILIPVCWKEHIESSRKFSDLIRNFRCQAGKHLVKFFSIIPMTAGNYKYADGFGEVSANVVAKSTTQELNNAEIIGLFIR